MAWHGTCPEPLPFDLIQKTTSPTVYALLSILVAKGERVCLRAGSGSELLGLSSSAGHLVWWPALVKTIR